MTTTAPENDLLSTGKLCEVLQATPHRIECAAEKAGIAPALRLNGVSYFDAGQADAIRKHLAKHAT